MKMQANTTHNNHLSAQLQYTHSQDMVVTRQRKPSLKRRTTAPDRYGDKWISILFLLMCIVCAFAFLPVGVRAQGQDKDAGVVIGIGELFFAALYPTTEIDI
jgi:hypothetical protein